jgi:radical SAM superfamily enzyme YgiQ (UPF0313 family)
MPTRRRDRDEPYGGFEQGPIRPPSEAHSLLIRVTRNCPWNRCSFCPVYKGTRFSLRPVAHVLADIDAVWRCVERLRELSAAGGLERSALAILARGEGGADAAALQAALHWHAAGMRSVFLQDANSLVIHPQELIAILQHLRHRFPWVERVTSYARSHTVARINDADLAAMAAAGLNRIHIGMESGSDAVLAAMHKGTTQQGHVAAGRKVILAGMQLSEYIMPGLGGRELSREHALETATALNRINPHFIRLRTLAIPNHVELAQRHAAGGFTKLGDRDTAREILMLLEHLEGITSAVRSDHILNLFQELEGRLPGDLPRMTGLLRAFLDLPAAEQVLYQVGRRLGLFAVLDDMRDPPRRRQAEEIVRQHRIDPQNVDGAIDELMKRFI